MQDRTLRETAEVAARCGYTGLEVFGRHMSGVPDHLGPDLTDQQVREYRQLFDDLGLRVVTICSYAGGFAELGDAECARELDVFKRYIEMTNILGCDMVRLWADKLGRNIREPREDHYGRAAHYLGLAADEGLAAGVRVLLENHLALTVSADSTLRLIRLIDRPNVVVNFDPGNMFLAGQPYGRAATLRMRPYIGNVQVKEGSMRQPQSGGDATLSRGGSYDLLLGEGDMDHMSYLRPLAESGYEGFYMAECHKHPNAEWPSDRIAQHEYGALKELVERAAAAA